MSLRDVYIPAHKKADTQVSTQGVGYSITPGAPCI